MKLVQPREVWDNTVQVELTIRELQILRDSMAVTSYNDKTTEWRNSNSIPPYSLNEEEILFKNVEEILRLKGGCTFE